MKVELTTTRSANETGRQAERLREIADAGVYGAKSKYDNFIKDARFKGVSFLNEFLSLDWDLMNRVTTDPAHEFHNLVKDLLSLLCNKGNMAFRTKYLKQERSNGRFRDVKKTCEAAFIATTECLQSIEKIIESNVLKVPYGWPSMVNYFGEDVKNGKGNYNCIMFQLCN